MLQEDLDALRANDDKYAIGAQVSIVDDNRKDDCSRIEPPVLGTVVASYRPSQNQLYVVVDAGIHSFICRPFVFPEVMISAMHGGQDIS